MEGGGGGVNGGKARRSKTLKQIEGASVRGRDEEEGVFMLVRKGCETDNEGSQ